MWSLVEGKGNQGPCRLNYDIGLKSEGILLAVPAESKLLLVVHTNRYGGKAFARSLVFQVPDTFMYPSDETTSGAAVAIRVTIWVSLWQSTIILRFLHRPNRQAEWGCGRKHQPYILQVLDGGINLCNPSGNVELKTVSQFWRLWVRDPGGSRAMLPLYVLRKDLFQARLLASGGFLAICGIYIGF